MSREITLEERAIANIIMRKRRKRIITEILQGLAGAAFIVFCGCGIA